MQKIRLLPEHLGAWLRHCWRLPIFLLLLWSSTAAAQGTCSNLTVTWLNYEPCKYRISINNNSECTPSLRLVLNSGQFATWNANTAVGWSGVLVAPNEIALSHASGLVPIGTSTPVVFSLQPGISVTAALLWDFTCGIGESCADEEQITSCPDPANASIVGVKYRECEAKAYTNQPVVPGWPIQLLNVDGQVIAEEVTGSDGVYAFYDLPYGVYYVKEALLPGWTSNIPASGEAIANLDPSEQAVVNFGNCPSCSCDSIQLAVQPISNNGDVCCYRTIVQNKSPYCFKNFLVSVGAGLSINTWSLSAPGWSVTPIGSGTVQVSHNSGYIPVGTSLPITFCVVGGTVHPMSIATGYSTSSQSFDCSKSYVFDCAIQSDCPNNLVQNGKFEMGTPNGLDEGIGLAPGWSAIWSGGPSTGDFWNTVFATPTAAFPIFQTPMPSIQGNFGAFWCKPSTNAAFREGIMNQLTGTIAPGSGMYSMSAKIACLTPVLPTPPGNTTLPRINVFGVLSSGPGTFPGAGGSNNSIFTPAPILLGTFDPGANCDKNFQLDNFIFNAPSTTINRIFLTREDGIPSDVYIAIDDVCISKISPSCTCNTQASATISTNGSTFVVKCDQVTQPVFACPTTSPVTITGNFGCVDASGAACQPPAPIDWKLIGPGGVIIAQNTITTGAPWTLNFPAAQLLGSGQYNLYMTTLCPGQMDSCKCEIEWFQECAPCDCGPNSFDMEVRYGGAQNQPVLCEETITLTPSTAFYPSFQCVGGNCNPAPTVDWTLTGPGFSQSMTGVIPTPAFSISYLLPGGLTAPGNYTLVMTGHCGTRICPCTVYFCLPPPPIEVRDSSVCRTDLQAYIPLENCPALNCGVMQVRWFLKTCSAANFPATPYQVSSGPGCADLLLLPYQYPTESCVQVYAEITMNGACCTTQLISNVATINLCNPISCNITNPNPPQGFCQCGTPQPLTVTPGGANCNFTFEWYFKGNLVGTSSTYQPPLICFEGGPNDCYTDHVFTAIIKGICAPTTCTTKIRVYNDNAPTGTIDMIPNELQPFCPGEDARLVYTDKCAGEPPKWNWFISHVDPSPSFPADYTPIPNSGTMNSVFYTNKLWQTTWYLVEKKNGACPADQVAYRIEVKNSLVINDFKATPDPCMDNPVALWVDFSPSPITGAGCQYVVEWYKDGNLIHTSTSLTSTVSYTYFGTGSAAGVYYAIVKDNCCPKAEKTFPIILNPACVPVISGPCFKCDTITPINIMGEMVLPPQDPCPAGVTCTYQWFKKHFPTPTTEIWVSLTGQNGQTLTITKGGYYKFESTCDYGFGPCVQFDSIAIVQCESTGMGCKVLAEKEIFVSKDFSIALQPNPTAGHVTVLFQSSVLKNGRVDIVDITGRVLASELVPSGQNTHTLSLAHLPEGIYFTRVFESNLLIWTGKIVRSK